MSEEEIPDSWLLPLCIGCAAGAALAVLIFTVARG